MKALRNIPTLLTLFILSTLQSDAVTFESQIGGKEHDHARRQRA